jgi:N-acetylneuraminic acid mutarotase
MGYPIRSLVSVPLFLLLAIPAAAQEIPNAQPVAEAGLLSNWPAPLFWRPPAVRVPGEVRTEVLEAVTPLAFVATTPCRQYDSRDFSALPDNTNRHVPLIGAPCGIPANAPAVSVNITVFSITAAGSNGVFKVGIDNDPPTAWLNYPPTETQRGNAGIVPLNATGEIVVKVNQGAGSVDFVVDVNGYYDGGGVITGVSPGTGMTGGGTSGVVTLGIAPGGVTSTELAANSVTSEKIAANAVTAGAIASGQVVKNVNGITDGVTVVSGVGTSISTVGSTITVNTPGYVPAGTFVLGKPNDTTLIGAGYTEFGVSNQDFWKATTTTGAPTAREFPTAVWTGSKMIVWGGHGVGSTYFNTGGQYDPVANSWTVTATTGAPPARSQHVAVWTGSKMVVWGGYNDGIPSHTGGRYDPVGNSWTAMTSTNEPAARYLHTAVWTGTKMIVWGGSGLDPYINTGGQYDPAADSWTATATTGEVPSVRGGHTAVWTGSKMIVWGGYNGTTRLNTGGQYDPSGDTWTATPTVGAPSGRQSHAAVWTGTRMVVWGGFDGTNFLNSGGQYNPTANSWTATTQIGAPTGRRSHTVVWTGSQMIAWGGSVHPMDATTLNSGGQYDPANDSWLATTEVAAPGIRCFHAAVWTGSTMIVWGGYDGTNRLNTGGQYTSLSLYVKN